VGAFVYRTIDDLEAILAYCAGARRAVVVGGGLLGLEAARAVLDSGIETHVVEVAARLMPRQLDGHASELLERAVRGMGVKLHLDKRMTRVLGDPCVTGVEFYEGQTLDSDLAIFPP